MIFWLPAFVPWLNYSCEFILSTELVEASKGTLVQQ